VPGRARQLCPGTSDLDFLGDLNGIIDLDTKISNRALDLRVAQQQLYRAQVASSPVDQRRLGSAQRVCAELERVEADAGDPLADETGRIDVSSGQHRGRGRRTGTRRAFFESFSDSRRWLAVSVQ